MIVWTAGHNMPGYLPEGDVATFRTRQEALDYTVEELRRVADQLADGDEEDGEDWSGEYEQAAEDLETGFHGDTDGADWYDTFEDGRMAYWFQSVDMDEDEAAEALAEE